MPYGKRTFSKNTRAKSYAARGRDARQNKFAKARTAVAKIQRKPYVPRIVKNTQSVYQLANAVKKLQKSQIGMFQKRAETFSWLKTESGSFPFGKAQPFAICLNQFVDKKLGSDYQFAPIYGTNSNGNGYVMKYFQKWDQPAFNGNPAVNPHWGSNDDTVSGEVYQPLGTKLIFEIIYNSVTNI